MEPVQSKRKFVQIWDAVTLLPRPWKRFQEWIRPWKRFQEWMIWILKYKLGALSQPLCCTSAPYNFTSSHFCPFRWWFGSEADSNHRSSKQSGATGYNFCKFSKWWQAGSMDDLMLAQGILDQAYGNGKLYCWCENGILQSSPGHKP